MSGARFEYQPGGSGGPGHMQRVGAPGEYSRTRKAYRAYLDHKADCADCGETVCGTADELWQAHQDARGEGER